MPLRSLKLRYKGVVRRFSLESRHVVEGRISLEELKVQVRNIFADLEDKEFKLTYKDEDDDIITILTDGNIYI
jgi:hypothetical protein